MTTQIIFIEGLFGSGKSTTAGILNKTLSAKGLSVKAFHEFDEPHPILIAPDQIEREILAPDILSTMKSK